jgi:AcrR family transcriptional regulator
LLEGALACFAEASYEDVTVPLVAKRLGVTHSLVYYYFKNKDVFFQASVLHALDLMMTRYGHVMRRYDGPAELLGAYLDLSVEMSETLRSLTRIMFLNACGARGGGSEFIDGFVEDFYQFERDSLAICIRLGVAENVFSCDDPDQMSAFISRNIDGIFFGSFIPQGADIFDAMQYLKRMICTLLRYDGDLNSPLYFDNQAKRLKSRSKLAAGENTCDAAIERG